MKYKNQLLARCAAGCLPFVAGLGFAQQYTASVLSTGPFESVEIRAVSGNGAVLGGVGNRAGSYREALVWNQGNWISLHPSGFLSSSCDAISRDGTRQAGAAVPPGGVNQSQASLWFGTSGSRLDLSPTPVNYSWITSISDNGEIQVGHGEVVTGSGSSSMFARRWASTSASAVALMFQGYTTYANAVSGDGGTVVGHASISGMNQALIWRGGSIDATFLHPPTFMDSIAYGCSIAGDLQVGVGSINGSVGPWHALLWRGTPESVVDLHPIGYESSTALAMSRDGKFVAGVVTSPLASEAGVCDVDRGTFTNLHQLLPAEYSQTEPRASRAQAIDDRGNVYGYVFDYATHGTLPAVWRRVNKLDVSTPGPRPAVGIVGTPHLGKNQATHKIVLVVETRQVLLRSSGRLVCTVTDQNNQLVLTAQHYVPVGKSSLTGEEAWKIDLALAGVPRFTSAQRWTVEVVAEEATRRSVPAVKSTDTIPLPVIVVRGLFTDFTEASDFEAYLDEREFDLYDGNDGYGTLFAVKYKPTTQLLYQNVWNVKDVADAVTRSTDPITYAAKCDVVAHSKGGLVVRQLFKDYPSEAAKVHRLLMCQSPHTGAAIAVGQEILVPEVAWELLPTHNWYRDFSLEEFWTPHENLALIELNQTLMPETVQYYLLWCQGFETIRCFTGLLPSWSEGDGVVPWQSQLGRQIINNADGTYATGDQIRAFQVVAGRGRAPDGLVEINQGHLGFLNNAKEEILEMLRWH